MTQYAKGLLSVIEFEKQMFMLYTKEELLNAAGYTSIRPAQMTRLFELIEEIKLEQEQLLQQTPCTASLPPSKSCDLFAANLSYIGQYCDCDVKDCKLISMKAGRRQ